MGNVFFALLPDEEAKARMSELVSRLQREHGVTGAPVAPDRLHVSVQYVGDEPNARLVEAAREAAATLEQPTFKIEFDRVIAFRPTGANPAVLAGGDGTIGVTLLRQALGPKLGQHVGAGFVPHVTLLYSSGDVGEMRVEPISWIVREIVLVRSLPGRDRHEHLARFPLPKGAIG